MRYKCSFVVLFYSISGLGSAIRSTHSRASVHPHRENYPHGAADVYFEPTPVPRDLPDALEQPWPTGDVGARSPALSEIDVPKLDAALEWAMAQEAQNTRALF